MGEPQPGARASLATQRELLRANAGKRETGREARTPTGGRLLAHEIFEF